jgi:hypothetical protein
MSAVVLSGGHILGNSGGVFATNAAGYDGVITVSGSVFKNGLGATQQLRGANIQKHVLGMVQGQTFSPSGVHDISEGNYVNDQSSTDNGLSGASAAITAGGPNTSYMQPWKFNCIRIGINEASVLGYTSYDITGAAQNFNNYGTYTGLAYLKQLDYYIAQYNAIGCYVILCLAFTSPGRNAPMYQDVMANQDNSIQCWTTLANRYGYPNGTALKINGGSIDNQSVLFELFNEPWVYNAPSSNWTTLMQGGFLGVPNKEASLSNVANVYGYLVSSTSGTFTPGEAFTTTSPSGGTGNVQSIYTNTTTGLASSGTTSIWLLNGNTPDLSFTTGTVIHGSTSGATATLTNGTYGYYVAGHQQMINAVRATGAWNPVLVSGLDYNKDLSSWATYAPSDSTAPTGYSGPGWTPQLACCWHPYPPYSCITAVTSVANGGSGYSVNDTILLEMDESGGALSGNCYWQAQLKVTGVSGSAVTSVSINPYNGGTPGVSSTDANSNPLSQFSNAPSSGGKVIGGIWAYDHLPSNPIPQDSGTQPGTSGTGATFNVTFTIKGNNECVQSNWSSVVLPINTTSPQVPIVVTETGEHTGTGIVGSPMINSMLSFFDTNGLSMVAYAYTPNGGWYDVQGYDFSMALSGSTTDGTGTYRTPSPGFGVVYHSWTANHAP